MPKTRAFHFLALQLAPVEPATGLEPASPFGLVVRSDRGIQFADTRAHLKIGSEEGIRTPDRVVNSHLPCHLATSETLQLKIFWWAARLLTITVAGHTAHGWQNRSRTCIISGNSGVTYQLAHLPTIKTLVDVVGLEPTTSSFGN